MSVRWHSLPEGDREAAATVVAFLVYAEATNPALCFGGRHVGDAIEGICHLLGCKAQKLRHEMHTLMGERNAR